MISYKTQERSVGGPGAEGAGDRGAGFDPTLLTADFPNAQPSLDSLNNSEYINIKKLSPAYGLAPTSISPAR